MSIDTDNSLVSLGDMKDYLGITNDDFNSEIEHLIDAVSKYFNDFTNRKLKARDLTEYYDGDGLDVLYVDHYPINSITHLYIDTDREYEAADEIDPDDYIIYDDMGKVALDDVVFSEGKQSVKIEYNGGYATIPYHLENACKEQIAFLFKRDKDGNRIGIKSLAGEGATTTYVQSMPETVEQILKRYWRPIG